MDNQGGKRGGMERELGIDTFTLCVCVCVRAHVCSIGEVKREESCISPAGQGGQLSNSITLP